MPPSVLIHGTGAIGTIYTHLLLQAGCAVTAVCRSNYTTVSTQGFTLNSLKYGQNIPIRPTNVVRTPSEAQSQGPFDYILITTKALPNAHPSTPNLLSPAVTPGKTTLVLIQNGLGIEDEYATFFPSNPLLSCVVYLPTTQTSPGTVEMGSVEKLEIGTFPASSPDSPAYRAAQRFLSTLQAGGSNASLHEDIQAQRWSKLLINASWNPICALTWSRDVAFLSSSDAAEKLVLDVMDEVVAIAAAKGYGGSVNGEVAREQLGRALERKREGNGRGIEPSMLVDVVRGKRVEVEVILGKPIEVARGLGVAVPRLETLYALLKGLDESIAARGEGA